MALKLLCSSVLVLCSSVHPLSVTHSSSTGRYRYTESLSLLSNTGDATASVSGSYAAFNFYQSLQKGGRARGSPKKEHEEECDDDDENDVGFFPQAIAALLQQHPYNDVEVSLVRGTWNTLRWGPRPTTTTLSKVPSSSAASGLTVRLNTTTLTSSSSSSTPFPANGINVDPSTDSFLATVLSHIGVIVCSATGGGPAVAGYHGETMDGGSSSGNTHHTRTTHGGGGGGDHHTSPSNFYFSTASFPGQVAGIRRHWYTYSTIEERPHHDSERRFSDPSSSTDPETTTTIRPTQSRTTTTTMNLPHVVLCAESISAIVDGILPCRREEGVASLLHDIRPLLASDWIFVQIHLHRDAATDEDTSKQNDKKSMVLGVEVRIECFLEDDVNDIIISRSHREGNEILGKESNTQVLSRSKNRWSVSPSSTSYSSFSESSFLGEMESFLSPSPTKEGDNKNPIVAHFICSIGAEIDEESNQILSRHLNHSHSFKSNMEHLMLQKNDTNVTTTPTAESSRIILLHATRRYSELRYGVGSILYAITLRTMQLQQHSSQEEIHPSILATSPTVELEIEQVIPWFIRREPLHHSSPLLAWAVADEYDDDDDDDHDERDKTVSDIDNVVHTTSYQLDSVQLQVVQHATHQRGIPEVTRIRINCTLPSHRNRRDKENVSTATIFISFRVRVSDLLHAEEFPPDANRGLDIPGAKVTGRISLLDDEMSRTRSRTRSSITTTTVVYTSPTTVELPAPDFSMPYNVVTLISTVLAFTLGTFVNILARAPRRKQGV